MDLEISIVRALGWSLHDIDETDAESLLSFVHRFSETDGGESVQTGTRRVYCDQVDWM